MIVGMVDHERGGDVAASATQLLNRHVAIKRRIVVPMYRHVAPTACFYPLPRVCAISLPKSGTHLLGHLPQRSGRRAVPPVSARILESGVVRSSAPIVLAGVQARAYTRLTRPSARADAREWWLTEQYADEARRLAALTGKIPPWHWASAPDVAVSA